MGYLLNYTFQLFLVTRMVQGYNLVENAIKQISGRNLKVVIAQLSKGTIIFRDGSGNVSGYGGYYYEQLLWISLHLNFSVTVGPLEETGNIFGELMSPFRHGEVDLACQAFSGLNYYKDYFDLSMLVLSDGFGILCQYPLSQSSNYGPVLVFSANVWAAFLVSTLAFVCILKLIIYIEQKYANNQQDLTGNFTGLGNVWIYVCSTLTNQGWYFRGGGAAVGIMVTVWCLASFTLVNIYTSCITTYMSLTTQRPEIGSFHDLAISSVHQMVVTTGSSVEINFLEAENGTWKKLGDKLRRCEKGLCSLKNMDLYTKRVLENKNTVAVLTSGNGKNYAFQTLENKTCRLTVAKEVIMNRHYFMMLRKNSPFTRELNQASLWWHAFGLQKYWTEKLLPSAPQCMLKYNTQGQSVQLVDNTRIKLEQFYVAFIILFIGYFLALVQFLRERYI